MRKLLLVSLAAALVVSIGAVANEAHPDCEAGQNDKITQASGGRACEGEQWDGQDTASQNGGVTTGSLAGGSYAGSQPNINNNGPTDAVHLRASVSGDGDAYARTDIFGVGVAAVYAGDGVAAAYIHDYSEDSLGALGITDEYNTAYNIAHSTVYPGQTHSDSSNILAGIVHFAHITQGSDFGEENPNCSQADYDGGTCSRDNTAVTVELIP